MKSLHDWRKSDIYKNHDINYLKVVAENCYVCQKCDLMRIKLKYLPDFMYLPVAGQAVFNKEPACVCHLNP